MTKRFVIFDIDTLVRIIRDHLGPQYLPEDVQPTKFRFNPDDHTMEIVVESQDWEGDQGVMRLDFQLKRYFGMPGGKV